MKNNINAVEFIETRNGVCQVVFPFPVVCVSLKENFYCCDVDDRVYLPPNLYYVFFNCDAGCRKQTKLIEFPLQIYGGSQQVQTQGQTTQIQQQQNAVRKINSLLQSGTVSVTQSSSNTSQQMQHPQTKVIQRQYLPTTTRTGGGGGLQSNQTSAYRKCFICDEAVQMSTSHSVADTFTASTQTKLTTKIARLVGEGYMVIIGTEDVLCRRCFNLFNMMDKAEADMERHKNTINNFLKKKYSILDEVIDVDSPNNGSINRIASPPVKMQRLNNSAGNNSINRVVSQQNNSDNNVQFRKINVNSTAATNDIDASTTSPSKPLQKGPTKLYKCMSCDYKSTDLSTFDSHYQECKGQNNKASPSTNTTLTKKIITTSQVRNTFPPPVKTILTTIKLLLSRFMHAVCATTKLPTRLIMKNT